MFRNPVRPLVAALLFTTGALITLLVVQIFPLPASAAVALSPTVHHTVIPVTCISTDFTNTFAKIDDFGTFDVVNSASVVEATFNGRISADSFALGTNGAIFELRVDDSPSPVGWARATFRTVELPGGAGVQASMTGVFPDLAEGTHTVSIWVMAANNGSGTGGRVDPGCWSSDHIVVREYVPFGAVFLPGVSR